MRAAIAVARKELRQIVRDRRTLAILLFVPAMFLVLYGYALNFDIRHVQLAIVDRDRSTESRDIVSAFANSGYFDLVGFVEDRDVTRLMNRGDVRMVLVLPAELGRTVARGETAQVQVLLNGDNANTATTVMGYALNILQSESARLGSGELEAIPRALIGLEPRIWYNPELRSALFLVPGLIAYIAMLSAVISTAVSIVREKERGTMEQMRMAPIGPLPYIVGKSIPYFIISSISSFGIVLASMALFGLPVRGSWWLLGAGTSLFLLGALGLGLLLSSIAETQQVAFEAAVFASFLPTLILSGFIFPIESMPAFLRFVTYLVPARYFLVVLRGVVLKGVGWTILWRDLVALALFAAALLLLSAVRLRREWSA